MKSVLSPSDRFWFLGLSLSLAPLVLASALRPAGAEVVLGKPVDPASDQGWSLVFGDDIQGPAVDVNIDFGDVKQRIDGFGANAAGWSAADLYYKVPEPQRTQFLDLFFSPDEGIGLTIIRNNIFPAINPSPGVWDWNQDGSEIWFMNQAKDRGVGTFISVPWSPPAWMKSNGSTTNGGKLLPEHYQDFADLLSRYVKEYKSRFGLDIYGVAPQNEPTYSGSYDTCLWTADEIHDFVKNYLIPTFARDQVYARIMISEDSHWREDFVLPSLDDAAVEPKIDIVTAHNYYGTWDWFPVTKQKGKTLWQTEGSYMSANDPSMADGLRWAKNIHGYMTVAEANAWLYWWFIKETSDGEALVNIQGGDYTINKRLYTLGNYSKFVRPGYYRIEATTSPESGIYVSAFKSPTSSNFVIVAINENPESRSVRSVFVSGLPDTSVRPYVTTSTQNLAELPSLQLLNGSFTAELAGESVTSFVIGPTTPPVQTPTPAPTRTPIFVDVPLSHPYNADIEALYQAGYTAGCSTNPLMYCPDNTMNRAESAVFVERGIHTTSYAPADPSSQVFADLPLDSWAASWVNSLWTDRYTAGCGTDPLVYCPWQGHTRAEGCVFYLRMLNGYAFVPPNPAQQTFADVPLDAWYAKWVKAAYDSGLIPACQTSPELRFCPDEPLTRGLAAHIMVQAKGIR